MLEHTFPALDTKVVCGRTGSSAYRVRQIISQCERRLQWPHIVSHPPQTFRGLVATLFSSQRDDERLKLLTLAAGLPPAAIDITSSCSLGKAGLEVRASSASLTHASTAAQPRPILCSH
eukprot:jgi/Ulvmu1/10286/UM060_0088.1